MRSGRATIIVDNLGRGVVSDDFILETENLTKEFAGFVAVNGVNLRVARGTIHALIGPNGAGKTTCFNLLTKFMSPTSRPSLRPTGRGSGSAARSRSRPSFHIGRCWKTYASRCNASAAPRST